MADQALADVLVDEEAGVALSLANAAFSCNILQIEALIADCARRSLRVNTLEARFVTKDALLGLLVLEIALRTGVFTSSI